MKADSETVFDETLRFDYDDLAYTASDISLMHKATLGQITPVRCQLLGRGSLRVLKLDLAIDFLPDDSSTPQGLNVTLASDAWSAVRNWPPCSGDLDEITVHSAASSSSLDDAVAYTLQSIDHVRLSSDIPWLRHIDSIPMTDSAPELMESADLNSIDGSSRPLIEALQLTLRQWLLSHGLTQRRGVLEWLRDGPIGHFGAVTSHMLSRTGLRDLQVDATRLAQVKQAAAANRPEACLTLYGERFGGWILHRDQPKVTQVVSKEEQLFRFHENKEVLVADQLDELINLAGLGVMEKRLFKQADLLEPERLHSTPVFEDLDTLAEADITSQDEELPAEMILDISRLDLRSRKSLNQMVQLAQQGQLSHLNLDLLYKVARQLSKVNRSSSGKT